MINEKKKPETPRNSKKLWAASIGMLFITLTALGSAFAGVSDEIALTAMKWLAYIDLGILGGQTFLDNINARNGAGK